MMTADRSMIASFEGEYRRYKTLGEKAWAQLDEAQLSAQPGAQWDNSVATIAWHVAGNLKSRFTDFLTSDGEKEWRVREEEFARRAVTRAELDAKWNDGWGALLGALASLTDADLGNTITIRHQPLSVRDALTRSLSHASYHVGQIVYLAKLLKGDAWTSLSVPPGQSNAFNDKMAKEHGHGR